MIELRGLNMAVSDRDVRSMYDQLQSVYKQQQQLLQQRKNQMDQMQREMEQLRRDLVESEKQMQTDMVERLKKSVDELCNNYVLEVREMRNTYEETYRHIQQLETEYHQALEALGEEQKRAIAELDRTKRRAWEHAEKQKEQLQQALNLAYQNPVEIFFPHRLQHYLDAGERARKLMEEGLYTLAANDYSNICMGVSGLTEDTQRKVQELDVMFEIYRTLIANIDVLQTSPWELKDDNGNLIFSLCEENDLDYWSDTLYHKISLEIEEHRRISEAGSLKWIHNNADSGISPALLLDRRMRSLETLPGQLKICISYALSACDSYNYLFHIRDLAIKAFDEQNYYYDRTLFGRCNSLNKNSPGYDFYWQWLDKEECIYHDGEPDYREERCMQFYNPEGDSCRLYMIPVRTDSTVGYYLCLESQSEYYQQGVQNALQTALENWLQQAVQISDGTVNVYASHNRLLTVEELKVLAAVPKEEKLSAKYCIGL